MRFPMRRKNRGLYCTKETKEREDALRYRAEKKDETRGEKGFNGKKMV